MTLLEAAEGRGKSWITMGLAVAVAESWKTFLGMPLLDHGNVLYVDQENPLDVIYSRLRKLGMTEAGAKRIHYLWDQGIKFDKEGKTFVEYAAVLKPVLVILDSLTRFHSKDEDKAGQMAELFNTGIQPLARRIGASVILIHHANKGGDVRGSTEIKASIDARLTVGPQNSDGQFRVYGQKSRRKRLDGEGVWVMIEDRPDGSVGLRSDLLSEPNF